MFSCALHNWFSYESPCPACQKEMTSTSDNIIINAEGTAATDYHPLDKIKLLQSTIEEKDKQINILTEQLEAAIEDYNKEKSQLNYWKERCEAAELNIETYARWQFDKDDITPDEAEDLKNKFEKANENWQLLKSKEKQP